MNICAVAIMFTSQPKNDRLLCYFHVSKHLIIFVCIVVLRNPILSDLNSTIIHNPSLPLPGGVVGFSLLL
jgi:hypothetical protein